MRAGSLRVGSLRARVTVGALIVIAVSLAAASTAVWLLQTRLLHGHLDEVLDHRVELVLDYAQEHPDHTELAEQLEARGLRATITAPDGRRYRTEPAVARVGRNLPQPAGSSEPELYTRSVALPAGGTIEVAVSREGVDAALRRLARYQLAAAVLALIAAALLLRRMTGLALRPLGSLVDTANSIADGDISRRLRPEDPETELGHVATAFNRMLDELEAAVSSARSSARTTREFLDSAAHQLRTPIAAASTSVQSLLRTRHQAAHRDDLLLIASRETARAGKVVDQLLLLARLDEGIPLEPETTELAELVDHELVRIARRAPHLDLRRTGEEEPAPALVDPSATAELVTNLLENASRHAERDIVVDLRSAGDALRLEVRDDGPGLPPGAEEQVFERFVSLDRRGGTGLGLAISRELAQTQGGDLTYEDGAFVVTLPRTSASIGR